MGRNAYSFIGPHMGGVLILVANGGTTSGTTSGRVRNGPDKEGREKK